MKYTITLMCGHEEVFELFGKGEVRERRASWIAENRICKDCYRREKEREAVATCETVTISYSDYKNIFPTCLKQQGSYDPEAGTITAYIPYEHWDIYSRLMDSTSEAQARKTVEEAKKRYGDDFWHKLKEMQK